MNIDLELAELCAEYNDDPLGWVMTMFDWGNGELEGQTGPDTWQRDFLVRWGQEIKSRGFDGKLPVLPVRMSTSSGHGIGKSAITAWIILFIMSTRPFCKGIVTANTGDQLRTKTWSELGKWKNLCLVGDWFEYNSGRGSLSLYHRSNPETWRVDALTSEENRSEAFAGLHAAHSSPFYLFDEACHDDKTEVMTKSGWKFFKDVTQNEELLTMNLSTRKAYYEKPTHVHISDYDGELITSDIRGCNFAVTPNHRMLFESQKMSGFQFKEAGDMVWSNKRIMRHIEWDGVEVDDFTIPAYSSRRVNYPDHTVSMNDWLSLLGWFITEGHVTTQQWNNNSEFTGVVISQHKEHFTDSIEKLVKRMGFSYTRRETGVWINSVPLAAHFDKFVGKGFNGKRVPVYVFELSPRQINIFIESAVNGDGYRKGERRILYTSSEQLAEDYNRLGLLSGVNSTVCKRPLEGRRNWIKDHWATSTCDGYVVSFNNKPNYISADRVKPQSVRYTGKVYCATVSGGVLYTRRGGYPMWSGNSAIPAKIWEVAEGGLTDGEPFFFCFGNPTRTDGRFYETQTSAQNWFKLRVDSRTAKMTNKELLKQWSEEYGEDSDFFRVRVRGEFPRAGDVQFIPSDVVQTSRKLGSGQYLGDDPLIMGFDVSRGGNDDCRIQFRRGKDACSEKSYRIPGEKSRDSMVVVSKIAMVIDRHKPDIIFIDATGIGGPIGDRLRQLGHPAVDVHFGGVADDDKKFANKTAEMGYRCREWLLSGGSIPDSDELEKQLTNREYYHNDKDRLVLERKKDMKKRLGYSPDWADALYLTFAQKVPKLRNPRGMLDAVEGMRQNVDDYNPIDNWR